jgi:hypothetical protein
MAEPFLALITPLTGSPSHPIVAPPPYPDQGLPGLSPGAPTHPIHIPGVGPVHPIVIPGTPPGAPGSPQHPIYIPGYPDQGLPIGGSPSHPIVGFPDQGLPPGGSPVPPEVWPQPPVPPELANQIIVAVHRPGQEWEVQTYPVGPAHSVDPVASPLSR